MTLEFDGKGDLPGNVLFFYGTECPHCHDMFPHIDRVEDETDVKVVKVEVWHNAENAKIKEEFDRDFCGGVPFAYNTETGKWICGAVDYEAFREWCS